MIGGVVMAGRVASEGEVSGFKRQISVAEEEELLHRIIETEFITRITESDVRLLVELLETSEVHGGSVVKIKQAGY